LLKLLFKNLDLKLMLSDVDLDVAGLIYTELTVCSLQLPLFTSIHPACKKLGVGFWW